MNKVAAIGIIKKNLPTKDWKLKIYSEYKIPLCKAISITCKFDKKDYVFSTPIKMKVLQAGKASSFILSNGSSKISGIIGGPGSHYHDLRFSSVILVANSELTIGQFKIAYPSWVVDKVEI
jgi:hypothetical protein